MNKKRRNKLKRYYLTNYRFKNGYTQKEVAEAMHIEVCAYNGIENGLRGDLMNAEKLLQLADFLHIDLRQLCLDEIAYQSKKRKILI